MKIFLILLSYAININAIVAYFIFIVKLILCLINRQPLSLNFTTYFAASVLVLLCNVILNRKTYERR